MLKEEINKKLEFKEKLPLSEAIAKTVIAFSNTAEGKLLIGVNDNKEIVRIDEEESFEFELENLSNKDLPTNV